MLRMMILDFASFSPELYRISERQPNQASVRQPGVRSRVGCSRLP